MKPNILLVIEERELRDWLRHHIDILWPDALVSDMLPAQFEARLPALSADELDLVVLSALCGDALADPGDSLDLLRTAQAARHCPPIVVIAGGGNELSAVQAIRAGAADYLPRSLINAQRLA
jgi:DNA-binding response OmpR family regulator